MTTFSNKTFENPRSEISFREILEFAPIGILIFQKDWTVKFVNSSFFMFPGVLGENPSNIIGNNIFENRIFENADIRPELDLLKKGESFEKELQSVKTLRGGKVTLLLKGTPITLDGEAAGGILVLEDIKLSIDELHTKVIYSNEFKEFFSKIAEVLIIVDQEGNVKDSSLLDFEEYFFLFEADTIKQKIKKLSSILFKKHYETAIKDNSTVSIKMPFLFDKEEVSFRINFIPFSESGFDNDTIVVLVKNLSKIEEDSSLSGDELKELETFQQIATSVVDGLIGLNKNDRITFWNESSAKLFGLTKSEVYGKPIKKIFPSMDEQALKSIRSEIHEKGEWKKIISIGFDEESAEYFNVRIKHLNEGEEETLFFLCANITDQIKSEKSLKESEEKFRTIVSNSPDFICTTDKKGFITFANSHFLEVFEYESTEVKKINFRELIDPEYLLNNGFELDETSDNKYSSIELPLISQSGRRIFVLANITSILNQPTKEKSYNLILTDITQRKESEKDLLLIRSVFEASVDGIALIHKMRFALMNDSFVKMFGYQSATELIDINPLDCVSEKDRWRLEGFIKAAEEGKETPSRYNFTALKKDGSNFEAENSVSLYDVEMEKFSVWVVRDETEERNAQLALLNSEEKYRTITESINECIWAAENNKGDLKAVFYTSAIKKITSYDPNEFLEDEELWGKIIHPDDIDFVGDKMDKLYGDPVRNLETLEYRIIDKLGNIIWIENKITVVRDERGKIQNVFGIISDVSLGKRAEEELKKTTKELKELNETKDRFISIVSHDLRTPFSSIIGFTDLLLNDKTIDEEKKLQYIQFIKESSKSMLSLVNSLLDWTRLQTGRMRFEPDRINARYVIEKATQILSGASLQKKISLVNEVAKDFYIHADEGLLLQVFNNLISNAIKFTKPEGRVAITAKFNIDKKQVEFAVTDDGIGIREEDIEKLFRVDTKFTTSGTAGEKGSGLGLSLVHDIIKKHGGDVWVSSEIGKGTQFAFSIPVASSYILLVDDSKTDRLLYSKLIKSLMPNYTILDADNGKHALDVIKESLPALVITDHKMPVMSGYDLVKQLTITPIKYKPPLIVLSGDINSSIESEYREFGVEYVFQKPVNLGKFKEAIERSLRKAIFN